MTDREFVIHSCKIKGLSIWMPKRGCPGIVAHDFQKKVGGVFPCIIDAKTWAEAKKQLIAYYTA
jgi:hypothetical protein